MHLTQGIHVDQPTMNNKVAFAFNTFLLDLIKDIRDINSDKMDDVMKAIRVHYKVFDKGTTEHVEWFKEQMGQDSTYLMRGCEYNALEGILESPSDKAMLKSYYLVFQILAILYEDVVGEGGYTVDSLNAVLQKIKCAKGGIESDNVEILDDRITELIDELKTTMMSTCRHEHFENHDEDVADSQCERSQDNIKCFFENSTIGSLAKEISQEINIDELKGTNPQDILQATMNSASPASASASASASANVLGSVVSKVSSKIHERIASGSLKQEDLLSEAMNLMSMLNNPGGAMGGDAFQGMFPPDLLNNIGALLKTADSGKPRRQR